MSLNIPGQHPTFDGLFGHPARGDLRVFDQAFILGDGQHVVLQRHCFDSYYGLSSSAKALGLISPIGYCGAYR